MSRFNVRVQLFANVAINGSSRDGIEAVINKMIEDEAILKIGNAEFVIEGGDVTGVFDVNWNELEPSPAGITPATPDYACQHRYLTQVGGWMICNKCSEKVKLA